VERDELLSRTAKISEHDIKQSSNDVAGSFGTRDHGCALLLGLR
jgi:hypothetical protein